MLPSNKSSSAQRNPSRDLPVSQGKLSSYHALSSAAKEQSTRQKTKFPSCSSLATIPERVDIDIANIDRIPPDTAKLVGIAFTIFESLPADASCFSFVLPSSIIESDILPVMTSDQASTDDDWADVEVCAASALGVLQWYKDSVRKEIKKFQEFYQSCCENEWDWSSYPLQELLDHMKLVSPARGNIIRNGHDTGTMLHALSHITQSGSASQLLAKNYIQSLSDMLDAHVEECAACALGVLKWYKDSVITEIKKFQEFYQSCSESGWDFYSSPLKELLDHMKLASREKENIIRNCNDNGTMLHTLLHIAQSSPALQLPAKNCIQSLSDIFDAHVEECAVRAQGVMQWYKYSVRKETEKFQEFHQSCCEIWRHWFWYSYPLKEFLDRMKLASRERGALVLHCNDNRLMILALSRIAQSCSTSQVLAKNCIQSLNDILEAHREEFKCFKELRVEIGFHVQREEEDGLAIKEKIAQRAEEADRLAREHQDRVQWLLSDDSSSNRLDKRHQQYIDDLQEAAARPPRMEDQSYNLGGRQFDRPRKDLAWLSLTPCLTFALSREGKSSVQTLTRQYQVSAPHDKLREALVRTLTRQYQVSAPHDKLREALVWTLTMPDQDSVPSQIGRCMMPDQAFSRAPSRPRKAMMPDQAFSPFQLRKIPVWTPTMQYQASSLSQAGKATMPDQDFDNTDLMPTACSARKPHQKRVKKTTLENG